MVVLNARNPGTLTGPGNNTYLVDGHVPTLIDAGVGHQDHLDEVALALSGRPLEQVLITHGHPDHASGVPAIVARWPSVEVFRWPTPEAGHASALQDGMFVAAGDEQLEVIHTPGHAADHVCFWHAGLRGVFCGDMMTATTTIMVPPRARGGDLAAYLQSLRRLRERAPLVAWPGHGDNIESPVARIDEYLAHRAERERQVRQCLAEGIADLDGIVAHVYADVPRELWPAARLTVEALLEKLESEDA